MFLAFPQYMLGQKNIITALSMLSIEKELSRNLPEFNELVINKFAAQKEQRMDFTLKYCN